MNPMTSLDYLQLMREAKKLPDLAGAREVRIAVLGDCATQQWVSILKVLLGRHGFRAEVYEAGYGTVEQEILNPESSLYAFNPGFIVLLNMPQVLRKKYHAFSRDKQEFATGQAEEMAGWWRLLESRTQATILQSNFVVPFDRIFGNFDLKAGRSFFCAVQELNHRLAEASRSHAAVRILDLEYLASYFGKKQWLDEKMWVHNKALCAYEYLPYAVRSAVEMVLAQMGVGIKCVVLDLDNTVWGGIIGDDGLEGIRLGHFEDGEAFEMFQEFLLELHQRGILLAVSSKNDPEKALQPFREHPDMLLKEEHITVFAANWKNKAENIAHIRDVLNIGYDSMVFLDDNPFERQVVRERIPDILVPELPEDPARYVRALAELNLFETATWSELDSQRAGMYREQAQRKMAEKTFEDPREYLQSLEMQITIARFDQFNLPRIAQLIQRSNQFNLMTQRFSQTECESLMRDEETVFPFYVKLRDKYGDNGLISVVVLKFQEDAVEILEWLMSCRVLARGVEEFTMNFVFALAAARRLNKVTGRYRPTPKNGMVADFFPRFGFDLREEKPDGEKCWELEVSHYQNREVWIEAASLPSLEGESLWIESVSKRA